MHIEEMINNSAFMGAIGVILGAIISGIINYMNGKQNHEFQTEQNRVEKVEKTAIDFLVLMQKFNSIRANSSLLSFEN